MAKQLPEGCVTCDGCRGDGIYYGRGYVENGKFKGFTGECFRCQGKGYQTPKDVKRNWGYDNFHRKVHP
jgi:hypothetical protein